MYTYNAEIIKVVDGDTVWLMIDLGFDLFHKKKLRMASIDADELRDQTGKDASAYLKTLLAPGQKVLLKSDKTEDKYGRFVATVFIDAEVSVTISGTDINDHMVATGHAVYKKY